MQKPDQGTFRFSTGRQIEAYEGIIGLSPDLRLYGGYDGEAEESLDSPLTLQERQELADHMIERWTQFKQAEPRQVQNWDY